MKTIGIAFVLLILLASCGNKQQQLELQKDLLLTKLLCGQLQADMNSQVAIMAKLVEKSSSSQGEKIALADSRKLASWRNQYLKGRTNTNLLQYADSLLWKFGVLKKRYHLSESNRYKSTPEFVKALQKAKTEFENEDDTLNHVHLFYFALKAEKELLNESLMRVGIDRNVCGSIFLYSELNSDEIKLGDSLYMMLPFDYFNDRFNDFYYFNPIRFSLKNIATHKETPLKIIQIGPRFVVYGTPTEKGNYEISGEAKVQSPERQKPDTLKMIQDFRVI